MANTKTRTLLIIVVIMVIISAIVALYSFNGKKSTKVVSPSSGVPNNIYVTPGSKSSEKYAQLQQAANVEGTKKADAQGKTFIPTIIGNKEENIGKNFNEQLTNILKEKATDNSDFDKLSKQIAALLAELNKHGRSIEDLLRLIQELQNRGYDVADLESLIKKLMAEGYNTDELAKLLKDLQGKGYNINDLENMLKRMLKEGYNPDLINQILEQLLKNKLKQLEDAIKQLQNAGYDTKNIKNLEQQLNNPDFTKLLEQLANQGYKVDSLEALLKQLMDKGYNIFDWNMMLQQLQKDGYSVEQLQNLLNQLKSQGVEVKSLKDLLDVLNKKNINKKDLLKDQLQNALNTTNKSADQPLGVSNQIATALEKEYAALLQKQKEAAMAEENAKKLAEERLMKTKQTALTAEARQKAINEILNNMRTETDVAINTWNNIPQQAFIQGDFAASKEKDNANNSKGGASAINNINNLATLQPERNDTIIKAGTILFAVLETAVNSDEPGPILAKIVQPPLKNTKLIGTIQASGSKNSETLTLNFVTANIPERIRSYAISAVAIDPNTARTALASDVDHHYLLRWGTMFAATFLQGYSSAVAKSGIKVESSTNGAQTNTTTTQSPLNPKQQLFQGLGDVASGWGKAVSQFNNRPITIIINAGISVGILFTSDFTIPSTDEVPTDNTQSTALSKPLPLSPQQQAPAEATESASTNNTK